MGGHGSTRWGDTATRATTGESFPLSTAMLAPYLGAGVCAANWAWNRGGKPVGSVQGVVRREEVTLWYSLTGGGGGGKAEEVEDVLPLVWTSCTLGGSRPWFACPGCGTRRGVLYLPPTGARFRCRVCHALAYSSTRTDALARATERVRVVQRRLKPPGACDPFAVPPRPVGMRARTYLRLLAALREAQSRRDEICAEDLAAPVQRFDKLPKR